jgi:hypothetical protein
MDFYGFRDVSPVESGLADDVEEASSVGVVKTIREVADLAAEQLGKFQVITQGLERAIAAMRHGCSPTEDNVFADSLRAFLTPQAFPVSQAPGGRARSRSAASRGTRGGRRRIVGER